MITRKALNAVAWWGFRLIRWQPPDTTRVLICNHYWSCQQIHRDKQEAVYLRQYCMRCPAIKEESGESRIVEQNRAIPVFHKEDLLNENQDSFILSFAETVKLR